MLSTKLGYGRPAALAIALAIAFSDGLSFLDLPRDLGRGFSQTGLLFLFAATLFACLLFLSLVLLESGRLE
jgi:hypothetical protein